MSAVPTTAFSRRAAALAVLLAGSAGAVVLGAQVDDAATVSRPAVRQVQPVGDVAVAYDVGDVDRFVVEASGRAAASVGGVATTSRSASIGMRRITRAGQVVHAAPTGYLIPMAVISVPRVAIGGVMGADVSAVLDGGSVVMNEVTADLTGAVEGDVVELRTVGGGAVALRVAGVRPYAQIGWAELVFTTEVADRLGITGDTRVVMWGFDDRAGLDAALRAEGVLGRQDTKVSRSWDPPDPDDTISTTRTKVALGEPWYRILADGSLEMHPTWKANNLTDGRVLLDSTIRIRAQCHVGVVDDLRSALAEVAAAGLAGAIDVANANAFGGCYVPRYSRTSGFLSRHTYGIALDTNTTTNCGGCRPQMNCDVVRIFRKHGFAWGGNFRRPDGMHFEWVGEPRDRISFPSRYCPNIVAARTESAPAPSIGLDVLTVGDARPIDAGH